MDILNTVRGWIGAAVAVVISLIPLALVLQVLFGKELVAFGSGGVVSNMVDMLNDVASAGLVGLIALLIIIWLFRFLNLRSV